MTPVVPMQEPMCLMCLMDIINSWMRMTTRYNSTLGTLTAIDLNTGKHRWQIPLGEVPSLKEKGIANTGMENYGGLLITACGLVIIAAAKDNKIRAFSQSSGQLLWKYILPVAGFATPVTSSIKGKQYIVIVCGGTKLNTVKRDSYIAFALP